MADQGERAINQGEAANAAVFQLVVEEYKSLREEIGRFQNQQKQLVVAGIAGFAAIGAALVTRSAAANPTQAAIDVVQNAVLFLLAPLLFGTISFLFFEAEVAIIRAGYYSGIVLKNRARHLCNDTESLGWESFRANHEGGLSQQSEPSYFHFSWPKILILIMPSGLFVIAFMYLRFFTAVPGAQWHEWHFGLLLLDLVLIFFSIERFNRVLADVKCLNDAARVTEPSVDLHKNIKPEIETGAEPQHSAEVLTMEESVTLYPVYRQYVMNEADLINARLNWLLTIQGFLFGTFGLIVASQKPWVDWAPSVLKALPVFGAAVSIAAFLSSPWRNPQLLWGGKSGIDGARQFRSGAVERRECFWMSLSSLPGHC